MVRQMSTRLSKWLPLVTVAGFLLSLVGQGAACYAGYRVLDWRMGQTESRIDAYWAEMTRRVERLEDRVNRHLDAATLPAVAQRRGVKP